MRIHEILTEKRRGGDELNPRISAFTQLTTILDKTTETVAGIPNLFGSFTHIDKLGMNPTTRYKTPLGIYSYPVKYIAEVGSIKGLPFANEAPYVNLFKVSGNIINISTISEDEVDALYKKIISMWKTTSGDTPQNAIKQVYEYIDEAKYYAKFSSIAGGRLWYVTRSMATRLVHDNESKRHVGWNKLFRLIGIDGCVDNGDGIIHTHEPTQAVFFNPSIIQLIDRIQNKEYVKRPGMKNYNQTVTNNLNKLSPEELIEYVDLYPQYIQYIKNPSYELQSTAIMSDPDTLKYIKNPDEQIQQSAVSSNPELIEYLKNPSPKTQMIAIEQDPELIVYIKNPTKEVKQIVNAWKNNK